MKLFYRISSTLLPFACRHNNRDENLARLRYNGISRLKHYCPNCEALYRHDACCLDTPAHRRALLGELREILCPHCGNTYPQGQGTRCADCQRIEQTSRAKTRAKTKPCSYPGCTRKIADASIHCYSHSAQMNARKRMEKKCKTTITQQ